MLQNQSQPTLPESPKRIVGWMSAAMGQATIQFLKAKQLRNPGFVTKCDSKAYLDGRIWIDVEIVEVDAETRHFLTSMNASKRSIKNVKQPNDLLN
jgi:hypothetical protein